MLEQPTAEGRRLGDPHRRRPTTASDTKMGYTLTRKPYLLVGVFHFIFGIFLFASGITWLMLTFFYWPQQLPVLSQDAATFYKNNPWTLLLQPGYQAACWIVYTAQIWTGFWIMLSGCFAMCVRDKGCLERWFFTMNVFNMILFAPAAVVLSLEILFNVADLFEYSFIYRNIGTEAQSMFTLYSLDKDNYGWILAFPIVGVSLGFIDLVLSIVSCSICACCRPTKIYAY